MESWVHRNLSGLTNRLAEHVYLPLARVALVIVFLFAVFPSPMLTPAVIQQTAGMNLGWPNWNALLNALFLVGLILPLMPETQKFCALILPLQSLIGVWIFVRHFEKVSMLELSLGTANQWMLPFACAIVASHFAIRLLSQQLSRRWGIDALSLYDAIVLCVQPPLVLLVSRSFVVQP
ncbi:MAG: hypothetical protein ACSHXK_01110 [Oceanococcus sp.]